MIRYILVLSIFYGFVLGEDKFFECNEIFKARKNELLLELERLDEQKQSLSALKSATEEILDKRETRNAKQERELEAKSKELAQKESDISTMLKKNEELLKEIKEFKTSKIAQSFSKMKPASAAAVLSEMEVDDAIDILSTLKADIISKILAKMDPKKASAISTILSKNKIN